jgi:hypothetical protein
MEAGLLKSRFFGLNTAFLRLWRIAETRKT